MHKLHVNAKELDLHVHVHKTIIIYYQYYYHYCSQGILQANWNEEVIIHERRSHIFNPHTLLLVELLHLKQQATPTPIAWGWVLIGRMPLDREICVKLYHVPKGNYFLRVRYV